MRVGDSHSFKSIPETRKAVREDCLSCGESGIDEEGERKSGASKVEGITFDMELMDFADRLDEETLTTWALALRAERADMEGGKEPGKK